MVSQGTASAEPNYLVNVILSERDSRSLSSARDRGILRLLLIFYLRTEQIMKDGPVNCRPDTFRSSHSCRAWLLSRAA
jgi:hypothetical protein